MSYITIRKNIKIRTRKDIDSLRVLCGYNRQIFNATMILLKENYRATGVFLDYKSVLDTISQHEIWPQIQAWTGHQIIKVAMRQFRLFYKMRKKLENEYRFQRVTFPLLLGSEELFPVIITGTQLNLKDDYFILPISREFRKKHPALKKVKIYLPFPVKQKVRAGELKLIKEIRILPKHDGHFFFAEFVCQDSIRGSDHRVEDLDKSKILSVSFTGNNKWLAGYGLKGEKKKKISSKSLWEAKKKIDDQIEYLTIIYRKQGITKSTKKLAALHMKRDNVVKQKINQVVLKIVTFCIKNKIGQIEFEKMDIANLSNLNIYPTHGFLSDLRKRCAQTGIEFKDCNV